MNPPGVVHFVTFSTFQRRRLLDSPETSDIVLAALQKCLQAHDGNCSGFVIMPDHVHVLLFGGEGFSISKFIQVWKKTSSYRLKKFFTRELTRYADKLGENDPIWQTRFYDYLVAGDEKLNEKLTYMHNNPVTAGLVENALLWKWSSARFYELEEPVGVDIAR